MNRHTEAVFWGGPRSAWARAVAKRSHFGRKDRSFGRGSVGGERKETQVEGAGGRHTTGYGFGENLR